jgi:cytochrome c-type biogenesis protein CcmH/NrfF
MVNSHAWMLMFAAMLIALSTSPTPAFSEETADWAYALPNELMSPFCPGRTLADCTSPQAASLRMWIAVQAAAGRTRGDVEEELLERYGDVLRAAPLPTGFGFTAYAFPVIAFLAGGVLVVVFLRRQTRRSAERTRVAIPLDPDLERAIDEELAR